jgi:hypothetical protein
LEETEIVPTPDSADESSRSAANSFREVAIVVVIGAVALVGLIFWVSHRPDGQGQGDSSPMRAVSAFVGEKSCRECHPGESALYLRSGHGRTLRLASQRTELARLLAGKEWRDPEYPEASFRYHFEDGKLSTERTAPGSDLRLPIEFAFGSGTHATTFVTMTDRDPAHPSGIEHRLTYYAGDGRLDITPGQDRESATASNQTTTSGRILDTAKAKKCFDCHSTRLSDRGPDTLDLETLIPDVSCERCHGGGRSHVEAARRGEANLRMPFGPDRSSPLQLIQLCGQCHRLPDRARPGVIRPDNNELVRFQPVGLMESRCYKASGGKLDCTTCHDPHARASADVKAYETACIRCHQAAPQAVCKVSASEGCIGCHMPRRDAGQRVEYADHWIRIHPKNH